MRSEIKGGREDPRELMGGEGGREEESSSLSSLAYLLLPVVTGLMR